MNILENLNIILINLDIPFATGHYAGTPPETYAVIIPLADSFAFHADNIPLADIQEARLALYSKGNYYTLRQRIVNALLAGGFTITDRRYIEFETDTEYHHSAIDVSKHYPIEEAG